MSNILAEPSLLAKRDDSATFDRGDVGFVILSAALVSFMIPGLAFLYSGLVQRKSALSLAMVVCASNAVVILQWFLWGHSLAFSPTGTSGFIGNVAHVGLRGVLGAPSAGSPLVPDLLYAFIQMEFAAVTVAIFLGGMAERGRMLPTMVLSFLWVTAVYCPLACWAWNINGWAFKWGVVDFSGGGPVEIGSGVGGLALSYILGRRHEKQLVNSRPYSVLMVTLGTWILWLGWVGFNAGCAFGANLRAVVSAWNTFLSAAFGGMAWCLLDYRHARKWSMVGFCCGTISGLIAATPSSGFVQPWSAVVIGILAGVICNLATKIKFLLGIDDSLDIFAQHAIGGTIGLFANAFFADPKIVALDGISQSQGGWVVQNWKMLYKQFAYIAACYAYTFVVTCVLVTGIDMVPGLHFRASNEAEEMGMDEAEIGEFASDFIEIQRDFLDWNLSNVCLGTTTNIPATQEKVAYVGGGPLSFVESNGSTNHIYPTPHHYRVGGHKEKRVGTRHVADSGSFIAGYE